VNQSFIVVGTPYTPSTLTPLMLGYRSKRKYRSKSQQSPIKSRDQKIYNHRKKTHNRNHTHTHTRDRTRSHGKTSHPKAVTYVFTPPFIEHYFRPDVLELIVQYWLKTLKIKKMPCVLESMCIKFALMLHGK